MTSEGKIHVIQDTLLGFVRVRHVCDTTGEIVYDSYEKTFRESPIPKVKRRRT